ncbi:DUF1266 domain-containing protein [Paenibacillus sp. HWE-109]|uniref:DUF1266 domain-containing protein n=1 Tax=Paenibacillus sp. HWE-109 TaxID=1306526 RepID=UPI001EDE3C3F|nr:DUF1266 domain-containing protein [Paenibacillus sp. HWE-109]UKS26652.1 DUF1266 domain-containing protein [Paenibacillus sp. HWE-109]
MTIWQNRKAKDRQLYMRALTAVCLKGRLAYYFTMYKYGFLRDSILAKKRLTNRLSEEWQIHNAQGLKSKLGWLLQEGNRQSYLDIRHRLSALSETDRMDYVQSLPKKQKETIRISIVNYYCRKLPEDGIAAYDYAQYLYLCRVGITLRYLTKQEGLNRMQHVAQLIQQSYSGWEEYVAAYVAGSQFDAAETSPTYVQTNQALIKKWFAAKNSPFRQLEWQMDLGK